MTSKYIAESQQRVLKTLDVLFGHEVNGLASGQIAKLLGTSASNATRDLANLKEAGFAEEVASTGNWRISPRVGQRALAILHTLDRESAKLEETRNRFTRI